METELLAPLFFVIISLAAGAILKYLLRKSAFPYTVGLFCLGILFGVLCRSVSSTTPAYCYVISEKD